MTKDRSACALELYEELESGTATWKSLHPLFRTIWEPQDSVSENGDEDTYILRFLAGAALKEDGTLMDAKRLVTWIAHLKYGIRAFCMLEGVDKVGGYPGILE